MRWVKLAEDALEHLAEIRRLLVQLLEEARRR
jgi:hypothetical protein